MRQTTVAKGLIKGQKIAIKDKPSNYNIMGELDLKSHFLKKLKELREMKEEYYKAFDDQTIANLYVGQKQNSKN